MEHIEELKKVFATHYDWHEARVSILGNFISSLIRGRSVNLQKVAENIEGKAKTESNYRRIQRLFQKQEVDYKVTAKLLSKILFIFSLLSFVMAYATQTRALVRVDDSLYNDITINKIKSFGDYYALLIYVDDYTNLKRLQTPQKDVEEIAHILKNRYGFVETKIVANPSNADALIRELAEFRNKLQDDDNLLIYYAGHGSKDGFWQLKDAEKSIRVGWNKHLINIC